ncbi:MAG: 3-methyladenine DNA glycosylase AlkC [Methylophagaceae bacterium]|jgi:3-methyladenine DNA glycosylase AlkC
MKDQLGEQAITDLADVLSTIVDNVDRDAFIVRANKGLETLALKQRVHFLIALMADFLPNEFEQAAACLLRIVFTQERKAQWGDFTAWPLVDYASVYGLGHPQLSLRVLKHLTPLFSAEFAVRAFIEHHEAITHSTLLVWAEDKNEHVRRLASEGSRPRLPWGKQLKKWIDNPDAIFPIIEKLKDDPSLYVRRSVANNLNDISKDHGDKVIIHCEKWLENTSKDRQWLIKHGLRTLVKKGHPQVFPLLGYTKKPSIKIKQLKILSSSVVVGDEIIIRLCLQSTGNELQKVVVDYGIDYVRAMGKRKTKVFKWKNITLQPHEQLVLEKRHSFKLITTRRYHQGRHHFQLLINGEKANDSLGFDLKIEQLAE